MTALFETWNTMKQNYQKRYVDYLKYCEENPDDKLSLGHLLECSYVLHDVYGLSDKELDELTKYNYMGLTDKERDEI